jgi:hypothetical protein
MKVIFLDIDGVLNCEQTFIDIHNEWKKTGVRRIEIDEAMVERLSRIVKATDAKIVMSSSWRGWWNSEGFKPTNPIAKEADDIFNKYGLEIYSITGRDKDGKRQNEIDEWLSKHDDIESFIIIDDETFDLMKYVDTVLIKTSWIASGEMITQMSGCCGLQEEHVEKAIKILNGSEI